MRTVYYDRNDQRFFQWLLGTVIMAHTDDGRKGTHAAALLGSFPFPDQLDSQLDILNRKGLVELHHKNADDPVPSIYGSVSAKPGLREYLIELQDKLDEAKEKAELLELNRQQLKSNRIIALTGALVALASIISIMKELDVLGLITDLWIIKAIVIVVLIVAFGYLLKFVIDTTGLTEK